MNPDNDQPANSPVQPPPVPQFQPPTPQQPAPLYQPPQPTSQPAPFNPVQPSPMSDNPANNPLNVMSQGERVICNISRHPIGLLGVYLTGGILIALLLVGIGLLPHFVSGISSQDKMYVSVGAILIGLIIALFCYVAIFIYKGNRWIVTSDSITQVTQTGLFRKQTSQLSLGNLEDVTYEQSNIIQTMFNFGTLKVETAGERSKFSFAFCPHPQHCAMEIIKAHEDFLQENPEQATLDGRNTFRPSNLNVNSQQ